MRTAIRCHRVSTNSMSGDYWLWVQAAVSLSQLQRRDYATAMSRLRNCNGAITQLQRRDYALCQLTRLLVSDFFADHTGDHLATTLTPTASWRSCELLSAILL